MMDIPDGRNNSNKGGWGNLAWVCDLLNQKIKSEVGLELDFRMSWIWARNCLVINTELLKFCLNEGDRILGLLPQDT